MLMILLDRFVFVCKIYYCTIECALFMLTFDCIKVQENEKLGCLSNHLQTLRTFSSRLLETSFPFCLAS